jgi:poly(A) polymerase
MMLKRIRELFSRRGEKPRTPAVTDADPGKARPAKADPPPIHRGPSVVHRPIPRGDLDPDAVKIVQRLTRFDHSAYLVGGCVRDLLLDRRPKDFDLGTSATPRQVKRLFRNCRIIGRRFRLAHIYFQNGKVIEVATFRAHEGNGSSTTGRGGQDLMIRDDNQFGTPEEDALRRDFTINSLFYDVNDGTVLDHADGLSDLRRRLVRTIGDPEIRFREDPIRILRAIKFAARLDFEIEPETLKALKRTRKEIPKAAAPRILEEINRFCRGGAARSCCPS